MKKNRPGRPSLYSDRILALKPGKSVYLAQASMESIKAIASRLGRIHRREFTNRTEDGGVITYRER